MKFNEKIEYSRPLISVQDMIGFIEKGEEYKKGIIEVELSEAEMLKYLNGVILSPSYQRDYRSSNTEESLIIESLLLGIPIPEIFLVKTADNINLRHVMDGQHRLNAIYRYTSNKYALKNLEILDRDDEDNLVSSPEFEGKRFSELSLENKIKILSSSLSVLEFDSFKNKEMEIELFKRYNKNTKPLEAQEIAMSTYFSRTSQFISSFINDLNLSTNKEDADKINTDEYSLLDLQRLKDIYNITPNRKQRQKNHQEFCIILNILENGPNSSLKDGIKISTDFLKRKSEQYQKDKSSEGLQETKNNLKKYNQLLLTLQSNFGVNYPFSVEITGKNYEYIAPKFQVGLSIILAVLCYNYEFNLDSDELLIDIQNIISKSPIGDETYRASTTNIRAIVKYLFVDNKIQDIDFVSLKLKSKEKINNLITSL